MRTMTAAWCLVVLICSLAAGALPEHQGRRVIRINAERFAFTPSRVEVTAGEEVELRIKSDDTSHGFRIVGTDTNVAIPKRGKGEISVVIRMEKPGTFTFECNRMCGAGHNFMRGELIVRPRDGGESR